MDAFEQQLKGLFEGCCDYSNGRIGSDGLNELCDRLELQHHKNDLVEALALSDCTNKRITYGGFKDALVKILGHFTDVRYRRGPSPSRDVSPKYVFGKKKYGRRSRPDISECESNLVDGVEACSVTEQCATKKRKTEDDGDFVETSAGGEGNVDDNEEEMLLAAWATVASPEGRLTKEQLVQVFQTVGLENGSEEAASSVFEKLNLGDDGITLEALLAFIKGGSPLCRDSKNNQDFTDNSNSIDFVENSSGLISGSHLLELWETAGIPDSVNILQSLGCRPTQQCDLSSLTSKFNGLLHGVREEKQIPLLRAGLILQRAYVHSLKGVVEQVTGENEKLKADVSEANQRAQMLALEVDEHHSRLEAATLRRVKALEQRHADRIREITEQVKAEQEQLCQQNQILERKLALLESDESKARAEVTRVQGECAQLQEEHQALLDQLNCLQRERDSLGKEVLDLSSVRMKLQDMEESMKDKDLLSLLDRVAGLEGENRSLRDRNDELSLQVEDLSCRLQTTSINKRSSPVSPFNLAVDASMSDDALEVEQKSFSRLELDGSLDDELAAKSTQGVDNLGEKSKMLAQEDAELCRLKLQQKLSECLSTNRNPDGSISADAVISEVTNAVTHVDLSCDCCQLEGTIQSLREDFLKLKEEDGKLRERCAELEKSIELLQDEYEKTEDYWSSKLEEERQLFDSEQRQSDEKYSELVNKILEYEEVMKQEITAKQQLETIEERDGLEKQVAEMEEEYAKLLAEKDSEIIKLQKELDFHPPVSDAPAQTDLPLPEPRSEGNEHRYCRRSLTFTSGDRKRNCCQVYKLQTEVKSLIDAKQAAQRDLAALLAERDYLYKQVLARRREGSCCAGLNSKLLYAERRCRSLMSTLRNQQLQTSELLRNTWQQHKREVDELRSVLAVTEGKLQHQTVQIQQQHSKLAASDILVKDLFVENAYLVATVRKLEACHMRPSNSSQ